jgi:hypothetical protein
MDEWDIIHSNSAPNFEAFNGDRYPIVVPSYPKLQLNDLQTLEDLGRV